MIKISFHNIITFHFINSVFLKKISFKGSDVYNNAVSLPIYYKLTHKDQKRVINKLNEFLKLNGKK